jgi:hypothetical protein
MSSSAQKQEVHQCAKTSNVKKALMKPHWEFGHETNKEDADDGDGDEHEQLEPSEYEEEEVEEEGEEELEGNENVHEPPSQKKRFYCLQVDNFKR